MPSWRDNPEMARRENLVCVCMVTCGFGPGASPSWEGIGNRGREGGREAHRQRWEEERTWDEGGIVKMSLPLWQLDSFQKGHCWLFPPLCLDKEPRAGARLAALRGTFSLNKQSGTMSTFCLSWHILTVRLGSLGSLSCYQLAWWWECYTIVLVEETQVVDLDGENMNPIPQNTKQN